jgi:hypothetical protein
MTTRPAHLRGGPLDGHDGEVQTPSPTEVRMGRGGGFIYQLQGVKDGVVQYAYAAMASRAALIEAGVAPDLASFAMGDTYAARQLLNGDTPPEDTDGMSVPVEVRRYPDRWELHAEVGGRQTLVESLPRGAFSDDDTDGLKQWVESSVDALAKEATKGT